MTGEPAQNDGALTNRRKRLKFRSWHRGIREMDLIMGRFADTHIDSMDAGTLDTLEAILEIPDQTLYEMLVRRAPAPAGVDPALYASLVHFANTTPLDR